ncbi:MAG: hypothetical protein ACREQ9_07250, partial [Candidatus Binatia bacterium]
MGASLASSLSAADDRELRAHLVTCTRCAVEHRELRETWEMLDAWGDEEPPVLLTGAVKAQVLRDLAADRHGLRWGTGR